MELFKRIFLENKSKILLLFLLIIAFAVVLFPYDDLGDLITAEVANATGNTMHVQFDDLALGFLPQPGIKMTNVFIETPFVSQLKADVLKIAPSLLSLFNRKPMGRVKAENLFGGTLDLSVSSSNKIKSPMALSADLDYSDFDLNEMVKTLVPIPMKAYGKASLSADVDFDAELKSQPDGTLLLTSQKVAIPSFSFDANMNGIKQMMSVPALNIGQVKVKGQFKNGKVLFADTVIGSAKDDIFAKIGGDIDLKVSPNSTSVTYYNLAIDLTLKDTFIKDLGSYSAMLDMMIGKYKSKSLDGTRYAFRFQFNPNTDAFPIFAPY